MIVNLQKTIILTLFILKISLHCRVILLKTTDHSQIFTWIAIKAGSNITYLIIFIEVQIPFIYLKDHKHFNKLTTAKRRESSFKVKYKHPTEKRKSLIFNTLMLKLWTHKSQKLLLYKQRVNLLTKIKFLRL